MSDDVAERMGTRGTVFVTVGTDHHPFDRLIGWVDGWLGTRTRPTDCFVQHGTSRPPSLADGAPYLSHEEMERRTIEADAIVCHGGPGTIMDCLRAGTKPIVVPRRHELGEHVDNHQVRFARRLGTAGYIHVATTEQELDRLLDAALSGAEGFDAAATGDLVKASVARFAEIVAGLLRPAAPRGRGILQRWPGSRRHHQR